MQKKLLKTLSMIVARKASNSTNQKCQQGLMVVPNRASEQINGPAKGNDLDGYGSVRRK